MINKIKADLVFVNPVNPVNPVYSVFQRLVAFALVLALAGCGMINWSVSNSGDGCPPNSTIPCP